MAADIYIDGIAPAEIAKYAESIGILGIGLYETQKDGFLFMLILAPLKVFGMARRKSDALPLVRMNSLKKKLMFLKLIYLQLTKKQCGTFLFPVA